MNVLEDISQNNNRIPLDYRDQNLDTIISDLKKLDMSKVQNEHIKNLYSLLIPPDEKLVTKIEIVGEKKTADLEINDEDHSYFANGVPVHNTINVTQNYPFENFKNVYLDSYLSGVVKGVTTYRSGTMTTVLAAKDEVHADEDEEEIIKEDVKLPTDAQAKMKTLKAEGRKWYLTVTYHEDNPNRPFALFVHTNAHEKTTSTQDAVDRLINLARKKKIPKRHIDGVVLKLEQESNTSKLSRSISFLLRHGVLIKNIVSELEKVDNVFVGSFLFQIKKFLSQYIKDGTTVEDSKCDACGSNNIVFSEGCMRCVDCGSGKCS